MATQAPSTSEPGMASLVKGIVSDVKDLFEQQIQLARTEIKADLRKSKEAVTLLAVGAGSAAVGVLFFGLMLVHLLHWLTAPPEGDLSRLPLWGCHAIVAGLFLVIGAGFFFTGRKMFDSFTPMKETIQTAKENVEWMTNSK
jgi:hypothetical protein